MPMKAKIVNSKGKISKDLSEVIIKIITLSDKDFGVLDKMFEQYEHPIKQMRETNSEIWFPQIEEIED